MPEECHICFALSLPFAHSSLVSQLKLAEEFPNVKRAPRRVFILPDKRDPGALPLAPEPILLVTIYEFGKCLDGPRCNLY